MSKNLLLEIGTEEMPANIMSGVVDQLRVLAENAFGENRISLKEITVYATPRRLAVLIKEAADRQPDEEVKKRGPSIKAALMKTAIRQERHRALQEDSISILPSLSGKANIHGLMSSMKAKDRRHPSFSFHFPHYRTELHKKHALG